jgi:hypothetical protein
MMPTVVRGISKISTDDFHSLDIIPLVIASFIRLSG